MIQPFRKADLDLVAEIWLTANLQAHSFIPSEYWKENQALVRELLLQAEVYVYEKGGEILGFAGLDGAYIEGIFVAEEARSQGIGKSLFYEREGFQIQSEGMDEATGEKDYIMAWQPGECT